MRLTQKLNKTIAIGSLVLGLGVEANGQGVVAHWGFDEGSGQTVYDSTGNGNNGTLEGGVSWTTGISGYGLRFDGIDDRVNVAKKPSVDLTEQVGLEAWIRRDSHQDGTIFSRNGPFFIAVKNDRLYGGIHTDGGAEGWTHIQGISSLQVGQWYKVGLTYDGSFIRGYVNDVQEGIAPKNGIMVVRSQQPWIGWGEPGQNFYFNGTIDEVKLYSTAVPEPSTYAFFGLGIGVLALVGLKKRKR